MVKAVYRATRLTVVILIGLAVLGIGLFIFLRLYGVPPPVLREVLRRVNAAGIPVDMESLALTFNGWRADNVRYYSSNPDDLEPILSAEQLFFSIRNSKQRRAGSDALGIDIRAAAIELNPAIDWGLAVPHDSPVRRVQRADVSLAFRPDRIEISDGEVQWFGITGRINGTFFRRPTPAPPSEGGRETLLPGRITEEQFMRFQEPFSRLRFPEGAEVDIDFTLDAADYAAARIALTFNAENVGCCDGGFSRVECAGVWSNSAVRIDRLALYEGRQSLELSGEYDTKSRQVSGSLFNSITSGRALSALPAGLREQVAAAGLQIEELPRLAVDFGPARPEALLDRFSGTFSIRGLQYEGVEIEALRGRVSGRDGRLECTGLQGSVRGRETEADAAGSTLHGGPAEGSLFWDRRQQTFGVEADANFDPHLLVRALSFSETATNVIRRFSFMDRPPQVHLSLGSSLEDWDTFHIEIRAIGSDAAFQGVGFASINVVQRYRDGVLTLDPVVGTQAAGFIRGSVSIQLTDRTVAFDGVSEIPPAGVEDLIYPGAGLFGTHINTEGAVRIRAKGTFDWGRMESTDFSATVEAAVLDLPVARLDGFKADVIGLGTNITVRNARFGLYGGEGEGLFRLGWNPLSKPLPYTVECAFKGADLRACLAYFSGDRPVTVTGTLQGEARIAADFSTNFFASAAGEGSLQISEGQLTDLPLFQGLSRLMRKVFPAFKVFSINSLHGRFKLADGTVSTDDAYFGGDVINAKCRGSYRHPEGYDALIQAQVFKEGGLSRVVHVITDPLMKLLEIRLEGTLESPVWKLEKF